MSTGTTRRQWLKTGASGAAGVATGSLLPGIVQEVLADDPAGADAHPAGSAQDNMHQPGGMQLAQAGTASGNSADGNAPDMRNFTGTVAHATHYGPFVGTVVHGRLRKVEPQPTDKRPTPMLTEGVWPAPTTKLAWPARWCASRIWKAFAPAGRTPNCVAGSPSCRSAGTWRWA